MTGLRYLTPLKSRPEADVHLICFPFAGGSASAFRDLAARVPSHVAVSAVQLPGREGRFAEPFARRVEQVVAVLRRELLEAPVRTTVFFGYSMGALLAFELARRLPMAFPLDRLVVSAKEPPHATGVRPHLHTLDDDTLIEKVRQLGGTPPAVIESRELMEFFLPRLRADFEINETYVHEDGGIRWPILALGGDGDRLALPERVERWVELSSAGGDAKIFPGKHFFFFENDDAQAALIDALPGPARDRVAASSEMWSFSL